MASPHSTVTYVEPNMIKQDWQIDDNHERIVSPEDYCIAMNIEVEISSRETQGSFEDGNKDVIILQWSNNNNNDKVSFMGGTKIGGYTYDGNKRTPNLKNTTQNLTTYYADMYVGDLVHYGTTEMIGIKSVNIEYAKSCVPIITVQFTDVRGLSLFQPTELSRDNTYNGIKGLNKDNVAQSFFQCFFKMPLPKFTIYIKGFYGNPVAYVCMCDKFDTNFNSDTGDFDVTARFIGYSYSFMTDVSFDALLAAPYSDFFGKQYWEDQKANGRFVIPDKLKTHNMPMPTLYEIHKNFKEIIKSSNEQMEETSLTEEEETHEKEIAALNEIRGKYQVWYQKLYELLKEKYGKRYCFDFKDSNKDDADWFRILILTNSKSREFHDLREDYIQYSDDFKKENNSLYSAIEEFNESGLSYKKLKNISKDFSEYTRVKLFNDCYVNTNTRQIEFGGFNRDNRLNRVQIINRLFYNTMAEYANESERSQYKDYTLSTIYNDGIDQYKDAFIIDVDYSDIKRRIKALTAHASKSLDEKEKEKNRKEHNRIMMGKMNWYPSIENFTKIMMAHLETFMMMMYKVAEQCANRKAKDLNITIGKEGNACDVPENSKIVPPFPRVVKNEIGEDGITKTLDTWVGEFEGGTRFIEADMINGLFNAIDYIQQLVKDEAEAESENSNNEHIAPKPIIKHPLTSYDFHITKNPYGIDNDVSNNPNAFAGKIAVRMFDILSISYFKKQYGHRLNKNNPDFIKKIGEIEAENFYNSVKVTNNTMLSLLGNQADNGSITSKSIIDCVKNSIGIGGNNELPWKISNSDSSLFDNGFWLSRYSTSYSQTQKSYIYPIQDFSFEKLDDTLKIFNKGVNSIDRDNDNIIVNWVDAKANVDALMNSNNDSCFGTVFISDDFEKVSEQLESSNMTPDDIYKDIYGMLHENIEFNQDRFTQMILPSGVFRPKLGVSTLNEPCISRINSNVNALPIKINKETKSIVRDGNDTAEYSFDVEKLSSYATDAQNKNITSWFFTECRGFDKYLGSFCQTNKKSLTRQKNYKNDIDSANWGFGDSNDKLMGFFLMGLEAIDYSKVAIHLDSRDTFTYVPKLALLQIGALLASLNGIKDKISFETIKNIPLPSSFSKIFPYLNKINYATRIAYIKYFKKWVEKNYSEITNNFLNSNNQCACLYFIGDNTRLLFKEDSEIMNTTVNNLMSIVLITKGNVNHYDGVTSNGLELDEYIATSYLDGFLERLRTLYSTTTESSGGDGVQLVKSSDKTTEDMKKELYRYLKLVYDKWVPALDKESWEFETFFNEEDERKIRDNRGCDGHLFHFIDSFYNKIGDKLLINPRLLSDKIDAALQAKNINTMMLGFMADVYSQNKCMMMCLQNFLDFGSKDGGMATMFKPIPYNDMPKPHKHPDFVVVYPYEPSKYLNVDNGEFNNDSFMLNDEFDTPLAVKSRDMDDKKCYRIPAFGVSYGKQYQSYFKKVSVGMANPIATQQAIMAKHAILRASQDTATKTTVAQDMYDIYATQSYTCKVEMMGCAWIQPLMYFVLTNVPMFRGSYLIFKVNHKITPGNMVTEFQGTRMANVSNKLVEEIFTDEAFEEDTQPYINSTEYEKKADIDNDCPYKTFPLFESSNVEISGDEYKNANNAMHILIDNYNFTKSAAAAICGNIYAESSWQLLVGNPTGKGPFALCQWTSSGDRKTRLVNKYGKAPSFSQQMEFVNLEFNDKIVDKGGVGDSIAQKYKSQILNSSVNDSTRYVWQYYERAGKDDKTLCKRQKRAELYFNNYDKTSNNNSSSQPDKDIKKDIYQALFDAVQKSINTTTHACELIKEMYINPSEFSDGIMMIKQADGNTDKLPLVFDILLNGYYEYVQKLWWVSPTNDFNNEPMHIDVTAVEKPKIENRLVLGMVTKKANEALSIKFGSDSTSVNKSLLKSIYKKYSGLNKEIPQFNKKDIFKEIEIQSCNTVGTNNGNYGGSPITDVKCNVKNGKIGDWNVQLAVDWLMKYSRNSWDDKKCKNGAPFSPTSIVPDDKRKKCETGRCWGYVKRALVASHFEFDGSASAYQAVGFLQRNGFKKIREGRVNGHQGSDYPDKCVGDITVFDKCSGHKHGHINMWCGRQWVSDFRQEGNWISNDANTTYTVWRYSGSGGHFTS